MINKENLTKKQVERLEELKHQIAMDCFDWFRNEQEPYDPELHGVITELGIEMVSLLKLYKEQLESEGKLPLSHHCNEIENMNIIIDLIEESAISFLPKGAVVKKHFSNENN